MKEAKDKEKGQYEYHITHPDSFFKTCICDCMEYIIGSSCSITESDEYMKEIDDIIHFTYLNGSQHGLKKLVTTKVFQDTEGKVIEITDDHLILETEY